VNISKYVTECGWTNVEYIKTEREIVIKGAAWLDKKDLICINNDLKSKTFRLK